MNSNTVAFRLPPGWLENIDADCKRLKISRSAIVRAIVEAHYDAKPTAIVEDIRQISPAFVSSPKSSEITSGAADISGQTPLEEAKDIARTDLLS